VNKFAVAFGVRELAPAFRLAHGWAMRKRRIYLGLLLLAVAIGTIVVSFRPEREPEYGGKKLSEWVSVPNVRFGRGGIIDSLSEPAREAVGRIGTNGLPFLMSWVLYIRHDPPRWRIKVDGLIMDINHRLHRYWVPSDYGRELRAYGAMHALIILGNAGKAPIPELFGVLNDPTAPNDVRHRVAAILAQAGQKGIDSLLTSMTNSQLTPSDMMVMFDNLGTNAAAAVPGLQSALRDPNLNIRIFATNALGQFDPEALERASR